MMSVASRWVLAVVLGLAMVCVSGCVRLNMEISAAPDGSTRGKVIAGVDSSLAGEQGTQNPFGDLQQVGSNWKTRAYREGTWLMTEATGSAPAGQPLFPTDEAGGPLVTFVPSPHRLSTQYALTLQMPPGAEEMAQAPEGLDEQTQALVKGMMASLQISFALQAPGRVVATTGTVTGPGRAEWKLGAEALSGKKLPAFRVVTELPNWGNLGKLGDQLAYTGRLYEATPKLAAALQRGLLPNPRSNDEHKLAAEDYARLLEIVDKLDAAFKPSLTDSIIARSGLNEDHVSAEAIRQAHERVMKADVGAFVDRTALAGALEIVRGR